MHVNSLNRELSLKLHSFTDLKELTWCPRAKDLVDILYSMAMYSQGTMPL